ncbi:hypothetical protein BV133_349 [Blastochloris viridis]|uniref:Uncharacterized protein n=1 Tax=Blastochloris viridis TaxID=1079 RepID=A0A182CZM8_BLAVI|nr:hypothetical protein BV133_349 [Blastochloris viridis]
MGFKGVSRRRFHSVGCVIQRAERTDANIRYRRGDTAQHDYDTEYLRQYSEL